MKTVKTYMIRKPADIDEVKTMTRDYPQNRETVKVVETFPPQSGHILTGIKLS